METLLSNLFPEHKLSKGAQVGWLAFVLLFPLALMFGSILQYNVNQRNIYQVPLKREAAIAAARQFVASRGFDVTEWAGYAIVDPSTNLLEYYRRYQGPVATAAQTFSPPVTIKVVLAPPHKDIAQVFLDRSGNVVGYNLTGIQAEASAKVRPDAAAIAAQGFARVPNLSNTLSLGQPDVATAHTKAGECARITWHARNPNVPGLSFEAISTVCGEQPVRQEIHTSVDAEYASKLSFFGDSKAKIATWILYGLFIVAVLIYSVYRYARRWMENEVSHSRTLLVAALVGGGMIAGVLNQIDETMVNSAAAGGRPQAIGILFSCIALALFGLWIGIAYGSGEGDAREAYPGKLTSLDAFLRGRILSRNVARSVLFGAAFGGWALFISAVLLSIVGQNMPAEMLKVAYSRSTLLALFVGQSVEAAVLAVSGILQPLAFLNRNVRKRWLWNFLLALFALISCCPNSAKTVSFTGFLISLAVLAGSLLVPFLRMDLLAAVFSIICINFATSLTRFVAISPGWQTLSAGAGAIAVAFLAAETWALFRGRTYTDDQVRPLYARHIAERQALQAEVAAAREAQLVLLPKAVPNVQGISITASCIPARVVGGDFYDFFVLAKDRLGIFMAEGGNRGIGSALNIALAKGFLMHTVRKNLAPHEIITRLEAALGQILDDPDLRVDMAYAVLDIGRGQIRYARTGEYPRVIIGSQNILERSLATRPGQQVFDGTATLNTEDTILLFTRGIAQRLRGEQTPRPEDVVRALERKRRSQELQHDLTAVVARVRTATAIEVVA